MTLYSLVASIFWVMQALILLRVVLSWVPHDPHRPPYDIIYKVTDPIISPCREILYSIFRLLGIDGRQLPLDFSPLLALGLLYTLRLGLLRLIVLTTM